MNIEQYIDKAKLWLTDTFDSSTKTEIKNLIDNDNDGLIDSFYKNIEFGTGGMRGIMGAGTNRINKYTLGKASQGLSNYIKKQFPNKELKIVIAYDCRHNSSEFAKIVADVFTANGIKVFLFKELRPTPLLSFAVRHLQCDAGIVLTASHNPPEYNGYKVYWNDGGQIVQPNDTGIMSEISGISFSDIKFDNDDSLLTYLNEDVEVAYSKLAIENTNYSTVKAKEDLSVVFTSLHGTSITMIPGLLEKAGYKKVTLIEEQSEPNGDFPTVKSPNPEEKEALTMALAKAEEIGADIVIGTDPDGDRLGIAVRNTKGEMQLLNGNQTMAVLTNHLLKKWKEAGKLNGKQFVGSTIVSTNLIQEICEKYKVETKVGLTGFKWIAKMIVDFPELEFVGGGEESFGYMTGSFVRDKDALSASLLACDIASEAKAKGGSFYQELLNIYVDNSFYKEHLIALVKKGKEGAELISKMMEDMRLKPVLEIAGSKVKYLYDYSSSVCTNLITNESSTIEMPKSNVLIYETVDGTKVAARPSGTEPKIKFYISVNSQLENVGDALKTEKELDKKIELIIKELELN
ncbi:MAG: phospho-sugar mutase [Flavobacteriaceae bacterium]|nr:phospho-sugar mutase [Flavobacteriaceae bacterium]